jgi:hypothetical protein
MRRKEPEFDQWTDQNHLPFCPISGTESQNISSNRSFRKSFKLIWHGVLKLFGHSQSLGVEKRKSSRAFLSWPRI